MGYANEEFWKRYAQFVEESGPRHLRSFAGLNWTTRSPVSPAPVMLDLGCGKSCASLTIFAPREFLLVDRVAEPRTDGASLAADYREEWGTVCSLARLMRPNLVVSLFSTEVTASASENHEFYERIFRDLPSVNHLVVSGFYYARRRAFEVVEEAGGLRSFQTLSDPADLRSEVFCEGRVVVEAPSTMFGPDVYEVWRMLERR